MPLRDDLLNPIPGSNPSGESLRYNPIYDKIKEARREEEDLDQGDWKRERKVADWPQVIKLTNEALGTKSKDLQLAVWLAEALLRKEGLAQFHASLKMIHGLLETFWDTLYPELEDGDAEFRATPLVWLGSRLEDPLHRLPLTKNNYNIYQIRDSRTVPTDEEANFDDDVRKQRNELIAQGRLTPEEVQKSIGSTSKEFYEKLVDEFDATLATVEELGALCDDKFGDVSPSFSALKSVLEEMRHAANQILSDKGGRTVVAEEPEEVAEEVAEEAPAEETYAAPIVSTRGGAAAAPARARAKAPATAEPVDAEDAAERVGAIAAWMRQQDPANPAPYLMLRGFRFGELRAAGESPSYDLLAPPPTEVRQNIKREMNDGTWEATLEAAESAMAMPCGRAWLDIHRYTYKALEALGHTNAAQAVLSELKALLKDLPQLTTWTLSDDTPTANAETMAWLKEVAPADEGSSGSTPEPAYVPSYYHSEPEPSADGEEGEHVKDAYALAQEAMQRGNQQEALEILTQDLLQQSSGRGRFQRKVQLAEICLAIGQDELAQSLLEELEAMIDQHHLDAWELPEMVAHPLTLLYRCRNGEADPSEKQKLYARICRLHPMQAFSVAR